MLRQLIKERLDALHHEYREVPGSAWITTHCLHPDHVDNSMSCGINVDSGVANCFSCGYKQLFIKAEDDDDIDTEELIWRAKYDS